MPVKAGSRSTKAISTRRYERDPVTAWAEDVVAGEIVAGPHVRNAAKRHLRDLVEGPKRGLLWDVDAAKHVIGWFPRNLRLKDGQFQGRRFELHPSQAFRVGSLFGWKWKATGLRRFRRFYDEEGKGNGKSPMLAGIGLYMLVADGEASAEVYAAGSKKDQAYVLFNDAVSMREQSPTLVNRVATNGIEPVWQLSYRGKAGDKRIFRPVSSDDGKSGPRPHCALCDEVHEHKNRDTIDMLERGFKFRLQPLLAMATNAGTDRNSICFEEHLHAVNVVDGLRDDDTLFAFVCALDDGDDWENDASCWAKVNPLLGVTITQDYLAGVVAQAKAIPGKRNGIARLHFCQWTQSVNAAISRDAWDGCKKPITVKDLIGAGYPCFGGLDLSRVWDFTALTATWVLDGSKDAERFATRTWFWTPQATLLERAANDQAPYDLWVDQGFIEAVPGKRLQYRWLADAIAKLNSEIGFEEIGCDQYGLERLTEHLTEIGAVLPATIHPQGFQKHILEKVPDAPDGEGEIYLWMPDSINKLEAALYETRIDIDPNPMLDSCAASVVYAENRTGHRMFDKPNAFGRIDGMVSLAMSIGMATCREREQPVDFDELIRSAVVA